MTPETSTPPPPIGTPADLPELRRWAFAELAAGRPREALESLCDLDVPEDLEAAWFDVLDEITVRAGIALDEPELVVPVFLGRPPGELGGTAAAMLARGVGAQWLLEDAVGREGPHLRFTHLRGLVHAARWSLARALASGELSATQREEGRAALDRFIAASWREPDGARALRLAERAPRRLRPARAALRHLRRDPMPALLRVEGAYEVLYDIAAACEPAWPVLGGPWWTSVRFCLTVDVSAPTDERSRHRYALADVYLELDDLPVAEPEVDLEDEAAVRALAAHVLGLADGALAHAVQSGLAGAPPRADVARRHVAAYPGGAMPV